MVILTLPWLETGGTFLVLALNRASAEWGISLRERPGRKGFVRMRIFDYARDYYGDWLAERLLGSAAMLTIFLVLLFSGVHLLRRSTGAPTSTEKDPTPTGDPVEKYELGARLFHWANFLFLTGLMISGIALFAPGTGLRPLVSWLLAHEILAGLFVMGLALHIAVAPLGGEGRTMWFERRDWSDLRVIFSNFLGLTRQYPAFGKYDPLQKIYHAFLTLASAVMILSGVFLFISAEALSGFGHEYMRWMRLLHDVGAIAFISAVLGHVYFAIIRVNWPNLAAMFTGKITARYFNYYHSAKRWGPKRRRREQGR